MLPVHADLPLVSIEVNARFDVVVRADGSGKRASFKAVVGVPFADEGQFEHDATFDMRDDHRVALLHYIRTEGGVFAVRHGLNRWQGQFESLEMETQAVADEGSVGWSIKDLGLDPGECNAVTGRRLNCYHTNNHGTVGDPKLERDYDVSTFPARLAQIRKAYAENMLLTPIGMAYRLPYPVWEVSDDGSSIELQSPIGGHDPVCSFGLDRLEDASEFARRLSGGVEPVLRGGMVAHPDHIPSDTTAAAAARALAQTISSSLAPHVPDLDAVDIPAWHDCANAQEIVGAGDRDAVRRSLSSCRDLARRHVGSKGMKGLWKWRTTADLRVAFELGEEPPIAAPRP